MNRAGLTKLGSAACMAACAQTHHLSPVEQLLHDSSTPVCERPSWPHIHPLYILVQGHCFTQPQSQPTSHSMGSELWSAGHPEIRGQEPAKQMR